MAWSTPLSAVSNATLTAAQWNASVRDNMLVTPAALATTAGRIFVATGTNTIAERAVGSATVVATETTTTTSPFVDLTTPGPACTLTTGTTVLVWLSCLAFNTTAGSNAQMGVAVSGASTVAAVATEAYIVKSSGASDFIQAGYGFPLTGLTAGSNTFTAKYAAGVSGTASFQRRRIIVLPIG